MYKNIQTARRLLVVSDTAMLVTGDDKKGYEPVVRELEIIADLFDKITWLGYGYSKVNTPVISPMHTNIKLVGMKPSGGNGVLSKLNILVRYPVYLFYILKYLPNVTHVHSRAPSHPALLMMIISKWDNSRTYWHKYAGNWIEPNPPKSYGIQRTILSGIKKSKVFGTINGYWPLQSKHLLPFENPCLYENERAAAEEISKSKVFSGKLSIIFVGSLSAFKGVTQLVKAINVVDTPEKFLELVIVGSGELTKELQEFSSSIHTVEIKITGPLKRAQVAELYRKAHVIVLPSLSEGFPKVIAEGAAYGCIPVVTNISSLDQYIVHGENGYLLPNNRPEAIAFALNEIALNQNLKKISTNATALALKFTYEYYKERIVSEILNIKE